MNWNEWKKRGVAWHGVMCYDLFRRVCKIALSGKIGVCIAIRVCKRISVFSLCTKQSARQHTPNRMIFKGTDVLWDEIANINHKNQPQMRIKEWTILWKFFFLSACIRKQTFSVSLFFMYDSFRFIFLFLLYPCFATSSSLPFGFSSRFSSSLKKNSLCAFVCIFQTKHRIMGGSLNPIFWLM